MIKLGPLWSARLSVSQHLGSHPCLPACFQSYLVGVMIHQSGILCNSSSVLKMTQTLSCHIFHEQIEVNLFLNKKSFLFLLSPEVSIVALKSIFLKELLWFSPRSSDRNANANHKTQPSVPRCFPEWEQPEQNIIFFNF